MNWKTSSLAALVTCAVALLSSCESFDPVGPAGSEVIRNPSVNDMAQLERQWGMAPRQVKPRYRPATASDYMTETGGSSSAPPAPAPVTIPSPAPAFQEPAPNPIPSPQPPSNLGPSSLPVDAATLNKLR